MGRATGLRWARQGATARNGDCPQAWGFPGFAERRRRGPSSDAFVVTSMTTVTQTARDVRAGAPVVTGNLRTD